MRWLVLPPFVGLIACGSSAPDGVTGSIPTAPFDGGTHDLSYCGAPHDDDDATFRCPAPAGAQVFALAVCGDLQGDNTLTTEGSLAVDGDLRVASPMTVRGDAFVSGTQTVSNTLTVSGRTETAAPLRCSEALDVRARLQAAWPAGFEDDGFSGTAAHVTQPTDITLGCGTYRLESLAIDNTLDLHVAGAVRLLVAGDVRVAAPTHVVLAAGASLEWAIGGRLQGDNTLDVGDADHVAATWLGVAGEVRVASPMHVYGTLFVPRGALQGDNTLDVWGGAFAGATRVASPMVLHAGTQVDASGCTL